MKQEKNIFKELPEQIKLNIETEAEKLTSKVMDNIFTIDKRIDQIMYLRDAYRELLVSSKSEAWFKNESVLKDFDILQESYDKEIKELNDVIQRKAKI